MKTSRLPLLATIFLACVQAQNTPFHEKPITPDLVLTPEKELDLMMQNISAFNDFLARRNLEAERKTCDLLFDVIKGLENSTSSEIERAMTSSTHQHHLAVSLVRNYPLAESCLKGVWDNNQKVKEKEAEYFKQCINMAIPAQEKVQREFLERNKLYLEEKEKIVSGIQHCSTTFANEVYKLERNTCIKTIYDDFFHTYKSLPESKASPCMRTFKDTTLKCVTESTERIAQIIDDFPRELGNCAQLTNNKIITSIVAKFTPIQFQPNITEQVNEVQKNFLDLKREINSSMRSYYDLEYETKRNYVFTVHSEEDFRKILEALLSPYTKTVELALKNNPTFKDSECGITAKNEMKTLIESAKKKYAECDEVEVEHMKNSIEFVRENFAFITGTLEDLGNVAILECFTEGLIFSKNMIKDCYMEKQRKFILQRSTLMKNIEETADELKEKLSYFDYPGSHVPCGEEGKNEIISSAESLLFAYNRCMYNATGTDYKVTTPTTATIRFNPLTLPPKTTSYQTVTSFD